MELTMLVSVSKRKRNRYISLKRCSLAVALEMIQEPSVMQ